MHVSKVIFGTRLFYLIACVLLFCHIPSGFITFIVALFIIFKVSDLFTACSVVSVGFFRFVGTILAVVLDPIACV
jgi:hypothetical protein